MTQRKRLLTSVLAVLFTVTVSALGVGAATAKTYSMPSPRTLWQYSTNRCNALSPNIVDNTYSGGISTTQNLRNRGVIDISVTASQSFWGYNNRVALRWDNLNTHRSGVLRTSMRTTGASGGSIHDFRRVRTGAGKVRIALAPVNQGAFLTLSGGNCSDVFIVR